MLTGNNLKKGKLKMQAYSCGKFGLTKGSFSAPFTALFFLCFGSELVEGAWELLAVGGLRLARSFLCLSISSLCWFTHSCCLHKNKRKRKLTFHYFSQLKHENTLVKHEKSYNINL